MKHVQRAGYRTQVFLHDVGVNLGGLDIRMAHQLLNDADIDAVFQQVRGVAVSKGVAGDPFGQSCAAHRRPDRFLQPRGKDMVAANPAAAGVGAAFFGGKQVLPTQITGRRTDLSREAVRQPGLPEPIGQVRCMDAPDGLQLGVELSSQVLWQGHPAIFSAFPEAHVNQAAIDVDAVE